MSHISYVHHTQICSRKDTHAPVGRATRLEVVNSENTTGMKDPFSGCRTASSLHGHRRPILLTEYSSNHCLPIKEIWAWSFHELIATVLENAKRVRSSKEDPNEVSRSIRMDSARPHCALSRTRLLRAQRKPTVVSHHAIANALENTCLFYLPDTVVKALVVLQSSLCIVYKNQKMYELNKRKT